MPDRFMPDRFMPDRFMPDRFTPDRLMPARFLPAVFEEQKTELLEFRIATIPQPDARLDVAG
jgi:hypothetical protein